MSEFVFVKTEKEKRDGKAAGCAPEPLRRLESLDPYADIMDLQHKAGNRAVSRLLQNDIEVLPPVLQEVLLSPGQPIDPITLGLMEERFGKSLSHVRVHTDAKAAESARLLDAWAYTRGSHIVFDEGQYAPHSAAGLGLLEHELTHVVEQQISGPRVQLASKKKKKVQLASEEKKKKEKESNKKSKKKEEKPLDLDDPKIRGIVFEGMYVDKAKSYYESNGYKVYRNAEFKGWLARAFKTRVKGDIGTANRGPDLVAIHDGEKKIIVADITATPASPADWREGDRKKLPVEFGKWESKVHLEKTIEDARQLIRHLPDNLKDYTVVAQDWYREHLVYEKSREIVVRKGGKPVVEIGAVERTASRYSEQDVQADSAPGYKEVRRGVNGPLPSVVPFSKQDLVELFIKKYRLPSPSLEFFQEYKDYDEYEKAFRRRYPGYKKQTPYGWYDPYTKLIHFPPEAALHTQLHETLHWYGGKHNVARNLGSYMNEGLTDWLMRKALGERIGRHAYDGNVRFVRALAARIGEKPLIMAFLHGEWELFHQAMNKQAGSSLKAQQAYELLSKISGDGKGIENLTRVYELLNLGKAPVLHTPATQTAKPSASVAVTASASKTDKTKTTVPVKTPAGNKISGNESATMSSAPKALTPKAKQPAVVIVGIGGQAKAKQTSISPPPKKDNAGLSAISNASPDPSRSAIPASPTSQGSTLPSTKAPNVVYSSTFPSSVQPLMQKAPGTVTGSASPAAGAAKFDSATALSNPAARFANLEKAKPDALSSPQESPRPDIKARFRNITQPGKTASAPSAATAPAKAPLMKSPIVGRAGSIIRGLGGRVKAGAGKGGLVLLLLEILAAKIEQGSENERIEFDIARLEPEILESLRALKTKAAETKKNQPDEGVFANLTIKISFRTMPRRRGREVEIETKYVYSTLSAVDVSTQDIQHTKFEVDSTSFFGVVYEHTIITFSAPYEYIYQDLEARKETMTLFSDTEIRGWLKKGSPYVIQGLPVHEKIRLINRLLDGWISEEDVSAIERICRSVVSKEEALEINKAIKPRIHRIQNLGQRARVRYALQQMLY
ncbi:MAG TPA: DUF4157 domain-containing protein [Bacillota bacterium]|jgi:hypothetical protein|nr:DUF4157 domain-containing protein [Peptococcaceae bacterium MAG4]NLW37573.1 DUF4157 domain-containing protein [Peptococcaceae bacterium]HPZ42598.1 DUF4157 domain-containing protein [Bacillota bacterium]